ncbi:MAG: hypothetical protein HUU21_22190 [Polyangiaceae bacterium]|nr:hypothetical protein [Polyangiaceae bacterium]
MTTSKPSFATSPLLQRIRDALNANAPFKGKLRVSVADEPQWETSSSGEEVFVRWACWNLEADNIEVTEPVFEVLSKDVTRERLAAELPEFFPNVEVEVDNAIEV